MSRGLPFSGNHHNDTYIMSLRRHDCTRPTFINSLAHMRCRRGPQPEVGAVQEHAELVGSLLGCDECRKAQNHHKEAVGHMRLAATQIASKHVVKQACASMAQLGTTTQANCQKFLCRASGSQPISECSASGSSPWIAAVACNPCLSQRVTSIPCIPT